MATASKLIRNTVDLIALLAAINRRNLEIDGYNKSPERKGPKIPHQKPLSIDEAMAVLGLNEQELNDALDLILPLGDRRDKTWVTITRNEEGCLSLRGDPKRLAPLRLTLDEADALSQILKDYVADAEMRNRIKSALFPREHVDRQDSGVVDPSSAGNLQVQLFDAIIRCRRCQLTYHTPNEPESRTRTIDPHQLEVCNGTTYLLAWDIDQGDKRRYRLDRIESVSVSKEEEIDVHDWDPDEDIERSMQASTQTGTLLFSSKQRADALKWPGIQKASSPRSDGRAEVVVHISSERWLFNQVLAERGAVQIIEPQDLVERFLDYAEGLKVAE